MLRRFDLIAFDWDGTLFDSTAIIASSIQAAVRDLGGTVPDTGMASHVIGLGLQHALALAAPDVPRHRYRELGERYRHHYVARQNEIKLFAGVRELLETLHHQQYQLAVATGKSRSGLDQALRVSGLHGFFAATRTADETAGKPDPLMLHELMSELGAEPARTLMIGDTSHDLKMALHAGCSSIAVSYGAHQMESLQGMGAEFIAHSVPELRAWLLGGN